MANQTIQNSIDYVNPFIEYWPLSAGVNSEPAVTIANEIQNLIVGPPFTWAWNRKEDASTSTTAGTQDYEVLLTDFAYLEKVTLTDSSNNVFEVQNVYNNLARGIADANVPKRGRPNGCCVISVIYETSVKIRFMGVPDQVYTVTLTYQKLVTPMSALTGGSGTWTIPAQYSDIYNNLFLAESLTYVDEQKSMLYRQRGVAALLAKAEGLTEMQISAFLEQYWARVNQQTASGLRAQQGNQARGV